MSVLVLEDDPVQQLMLVQHLQTLDYRVVTAGSISEAGEILAQQQLNLAIVDIQLPDGCGFDLCERIDNDARHVGLPMIVLSSMRCEDAVRRTRAAGGCYFLSKPYDPNVLLAIIERALGEG